MQKDYYKHDFLKDIEVDGKTNHFWGFTLGFGWSMFFIGVGIGIYQLIKYLVS